MELIAPIFVICFGLILGSFFNVMIWRLPRHESVVIPSSHCPKCGRPIRPWENIPVLSYLLLRGKCAGCGQNISLQYPLVELATAAAALFLWRTMAARCFFAQDYELTVADAHLALQCFVLLVMVPVIVIDLRHFIIPDRITLPLCAAALCASFLPGYTTPFQSVAGILAGGGTLYALGWLGKIIFRKGDAMGGGDIKLLAGIGALWGPKSALLTVLFGSMVGTMAVLVLVIAQRLPKDRRIPFGPFLATGLWVTVLAGDLLVTSYMQFVAGIVYPG